MRNGERAHWTSIALLTGRLERTQFPPSTVDLPR